MTGDQSLAAKNTVSLRHRVEAIILDTATARQIARDLDNAAEILADAADLVPGRVGHDLIGLSRKAHWLAARTFHATRPRDRETRSPRAQANLKEPQ
jgi:hypothetical protein